MLSCVLKYIILGWTAIFCKFIAVLEKNWPGLAEIEKFGSYYHNYSNFFQLTQASSVCVSDNCSCQKLDAMTQQWPFSERRLKKILQKVVEETQRAREGVYTWLTVESLDKEIDNFLDDPTKEVFLKSFEDGEHELAIHFMNLHPAK